MQSRSSASPRRTVPSRSAGGSWLGAALAIMFASLPIGVMLMVFPTGLA